MPCHRIINNNTTSATIGTGTAHPFGESERTSDLSGVRLLNLYYFDPPFLSFCSFSFGHCVVSAASCFFFTFDINVDCFRVRIDIWHEGAHDESRTTITWHLTLSENWTNWKGDNSVIKLFITLLELLVIFWKFYYCPRSIVLRAKCQKWLNFDQYFSNNSDENMFKKQ